MGTNAIGAMIVAGPEGFRKNSYRKFNIKRPETAAGDDFAMMREVLERRFARLEKEDPDRSSGEWPDLLLIDGGKGQLSAVCEVMEDAGVHDVPVVGVAKGPHHGREGREVFHFPGGREMTLPPNSALLFYLQRLRDEAHRFAIGAHRAKRAQEPDDVDARRRPGHRPEPQARAADALRHGAGGEGRGARGSRAGARHQQDDGAPALRLFPPGRVMLLPPRAAVGEAIVSTQSRARPNRVKQAYCCPATVASRPSNLSLDDEHHHDRRTLASLAADDRHLRRSCRRARDPHRGAAADR